MVDATLLQQELGLTLREFQVLDYIRSHRPRPVPCDEINEAVFGRYASPDSARQYIHRLRNKLGPTAIVTVHGFGVRFGMAKVVEANPRCPDCGRAIARYEDEWTCFACGASGSRRQLERLDLDVGRAPGEGARSGKDWSEAEEAFLLANRASMTHEQIGEHLGRSTRAVRGHEQALGLGAKPYVLTRTRGSK